MATKVLLNLPEIISQGWQKTKDVVTESTQKVTDSVQETLSKAANTVTSATDKAIDSVTTTASDSLNKVTTSIGQTTNATTEVVQRAIANSITDWLQTHPAFERFFNMIGWGFNHPIISVIILLLLIAFLWSIVQGISRLITLASWSLFLVPLKLLWAGVKVGFVYLGKWSVVGFNQLRGVKPIAVEEETPALAEGQIAEETKPDTQQRLAEITARLEAIQQEQRELLAEAKIILALDKVDVEV
ncbi:MAG: hypothetical protein VKL59_10270 [Nostocaceae cyanobacterium]|nr:hypothetical protein [Nostocaceae cyanobacterium]